MGYYFLQIRKFYTPYSREERFIMNLSENVQSYATSAAILAGGVLMVSAAFALRGSIKVNHARALNLTADAGRLVSLSAKYDAKAAVDNLRVLKEAID